MAFLNNLKISTKILALLLMLGAAMAVVSFLGVRSLRTVDTAYTELVAHNMPATQKLVRANRTAVEIVYGGYRALQYDPSSVESRDAVATFETARAATEANFAAAAELRPGMAEQVRELRTRTEALSGLVTQAIAAHRMGDDALAAAQIVRADALMHELQAKMRALNEASSASDEAQSRTLSADSRSAIRWMIIVAAIAVVGGVVSALMVARMGITRPLAAIQRAMRELAAGNNGVDVPGVTRGDEVGAMAQSVLIFRDAAQAQERAAAAKAQADAEQQHVVEVVGQRLGMVAEGDLTAVIAEEFPPAYVALRDNYNGALASLRTLITSVMQGAESIRGGAGEIAGASEDLARRTESSAASLEETSAAISEMEGRLGSTAGAARNTVERANGTMRVVGEGRTLADDAVKAMERVSDSAKGIDDVIEGLDKIAFQTRVLAMNAAVEAGRAGEAGRGFAVVADLVSALAMRAEEESKRARDQLTVTQAEVHSAVDAVTRVDSALSNIVADVGEVHRLLSEISSDNDAQSSTIVQINSAVTTMDQATQQNAAMVEEASAAARNLLVEAGSLTDQTARFRVGSKTVAASPSVARRPASADPVRESVLH